MRNWLEKLTPPSWLVKKALLVAVLVVVGAAAFCWGRRQSVSADGPRNPYARSSGEDTKDSCRMMVVRAGSAAVARQGWEDERKGRGSFLQQAGKQLIPNLAKDAGEVPPIHHHFGDKSLEDAAFRLKVGEVSEPL